MKPCSMCELRCSMDGERVIGNLRHSTWRIRQSLWRRKSHIGNYIMRLPGLAWTLLLLTATAEGATYYVATDGVDAPGCGSHSTPCRHLYYTSWQMHSGDTMAILPGTYVDHLAVDDGKDFLDYPGRERWSPELPNGTASQPTTIKAANGPGTVTIQPDAYGGVSFGAVSYIVLDGLILDGGLDIGIGISGRRSDHVTVQNGEIKNKVTIPLCQVKVC